MPPTPTPRGRCWGVGPAAALAIVAVTALAHCAPVEIRPQIDERVASKTDTLDLRGLTPEQAVEMGALLATRHYGHGSSPRNVLHLRTDLAEPGVFALLIRAASVGGARLQVTVGGTIFSRTWPPADSTHREGRLYGVPVPAGEQHLRVEAVSGVVVVDAYVLYPTTAEALREAIAMLEEQEPPTFPKLDGYRGIWYYNQKSDDEYVYKYSGGLGTYCAKHIPLAVYSEAADKTFFVYGGTADDARRLLIMASYYDHRTGLVPRPTMVIDKQTDDAHDNPTIALDDAGHVWVFASSHGTGRPSYIFRSRTPHSVDDFETVRVTNFSYPQTHYLPGKGFFFLQTIYQGGRRLFWQTSADGREWGEPRELATIEQGHYQVSNWRGDGVGSAFNYHPEPQGLNWRTNLYYVQTADFGASWQNAAGEKVEVPITTVDGNALVHDYRAEGLNVYMKDLVFDARGHPVILYVTSRGYESGPKNAPRTWTTARWDGTQWDIRGSITSDNNYDTGCLHIEADGTWRLIGPTETGPQPYNPGGEMAMWVSENRGETWRKVADLTHDSPYNHTYARRPVNAHPDFYAFWADGHGRRPSESRLYFCDKSGQRVRRLPQRMEADFALPETVR